MIQVRTLNELIIDPCSVAALEIMKDKSASLLDYFGMLAGNPRVGKDNIVIFCPAQGYLLLVERKIDRWLTAYVDLKLRHVFFSF